MRTARLGRCATSVAALAVVLGACSAGSDEAGEGSDPEPEVTDAAAEVPGPDPDPSEGCGVAPDVATVSDEAPGDVALELPTDGGPRTYRLGVPSSYDPEVPAPLVVNLHGSGSNAEQASAYADLPRAASARGVVTVAPEARDGRWQLGSNGDDDAFIVDLVSDVEQRYCIDRARVHLAGMSLGAWKAAVTACAHPDRFASLALVTVEVFPGECEPMPVVAFHGTADVVVPYGEGGDDVDTSGSPNAGLPGARDNIAAWALSGGCDPDPSIDEIGDDVTRWSYPRCDPGIGVELYTIDGGRHTWPGSEIKIGPPEATTDTIDATELALDWFEAHPRRGA